MTLPATGTYLPDPLDTRPFGLDISSNQGVVDFKKMLSAHPRPRFVICRTGISWGYKDKYHRLYWDQLGEVGIPRAAYHVLYPGEDISRQVKNFLSMFPDGDFGEGPIVDDVELVHGVSKRQLSNAAEAFSCGLEDATGKEVYLYSRYSFVRDYMEYQPWMERRKWIMAAYIDGVLSPPLREWGAGPNVIAGLERLPVAMLQTGEKGDGKYYGAASAQIDTDRWLLGEDAFVKAFAAKPASPKPATWTESIDAWARTMGYVGPTP